MLTHFRRFRLERDLTTGLIADPGCPEGYRCLPWSPRLIAAHARAKYHSFRSELDVSVFPCLGDRDGCLQLMQEIVGRNGFAPEATWLIVCDRQPETAVRSADPDGEPVGTIQGIVTDERTGTIQNIGIAPPHRGQGLGRLLIGRALAGFQSLGILRAVLEVTALNQNACRLYERLGFRFQRVVFKFQDIAPIE